MHDTVKHIGGTITSGFGFLGWITLDAANKWAALTCALLGAIAAALTIASIIKKWGDK